MLSDGLQKITLIMKNKVQKLHFIFFVPHDINKIEDENLKKIQNQEFFQNSEKNLE